MMVFVPDNYDYFRMHEEKLIEEQRQERRRQLDELDEPEDWEDEEWD